MTQSRHISAPLRCILLLGTLVIFLAPFLAQAVPPKYFVVNDPRIEIHSGQIVVKMGISFDNVTGLFEMLKDGASVELVVSTRIERMRTLWSNVTLAETEVVSALQHNPLTREFSLYMKDGAKPLLDKNLDRLLAATWSKLELGYGSVSLLDGEEKGTRYRAVVTLSLQHAKVPPWLEKNFVFWSKNVLDPETILLPFTY